MFPLFVLIAFCNMIMEFSLEASCITSVFLGVTSEAKRFFVSYSMIHIIILACLLFPQVRGGDAWAATAVQVAAKAGQSGVPMWTAGRHFTPTVTRASVPPTRGTVSVCVTFTRTFMTGNWVPGMSACQCQQGPLGPRGRSHAVEAKRAFRPGRWSAYSNQTGLQQRMPSVNTLSPSLAWSRHV